MKETTSLTLKESAAFLGGNDYLRDVAILVIAYGTSINIVEGARVFLSMAVSRFEIAGYVGAVPVRWDGGGGGGGGGGDLRGGGFREGASGGVGSVGHVGGRVGAGVWTCVMNAAVSGFVGDRSRDAAGREHHHDEIGQDEGLSR